MKHLIYTTKQQAQDRCDKAFLDMNCTDINTTAYAIPINHIDRDLWAVPIDDNYTHLFTEQEINESVELPQDWFPKIEFNNE